AVHCWRPFRGVILGRTTFPTGRQEPARAGPHLPAGTGRAGSARGRRSHVEPPARLLPRDIIRGARCGLARIPWPPVDPDDRCPSVPRMSLNDITRDAVL